MTSDNVYDLIEQIAADSSKTGKEALIRAHAGDGLFPRVLVNALDPFTTYGIAKKPVCVVGAGGEQFEPDTWLTLHKLSTRELSGNAAVDAVAEQLTTLTAKSAELFWRIVTKDLRAGFSESTVNKAILGLITTFDCMLAHPFEEKRVKTWPQVIEPKLDGVRVLAFVSAKRETVHFFSRSGKEFTTFEHLKLPLRALCVDQEDLVLDGEMVSGDFNKTVGDVRRKSEQATDARFNVFDVLPLTIFNTDGKDGVGKPFLHRRKQLMELFRTVISPVDPMSPQIVLNPAWIVNSHEEIRARYDECRSQGLEGVIVKDPAALYHRRRNYGWLKIKNESSVDVQIIDAEEGTGKFVGMLGALVVDYKGKPVNVGSGLTDDQRRSFWDAFCADKRLWPEPQQLLGRLIEVEYHEETLDGSLRHPRFVRFRNDKPLREAA